MPYRLYPKHFKVMGNHFYGNDSELSMVDWFKFYLLMLGKVSVVFGNLIINECLM